MTTRTALDGLSGLREFHEFQPDLVVLDIMLPGMDGLELLTHLRRESEVYVILLTAKAEEMDKIVGLSVGADDYVTKPFSPRELAARVKAALRRQRVDAPIEETELVFRHLRINLPGNQVWVLGEAVDLTPIEFQLLKALAQRYGMVLSREKLLEIVWGYQYIDETKVVDVHIGHLRRKLGEDHGIATVRGVGYRFDAEKSG